MYELTQLKFIILLTIKYEHCDTLTRLIAKQFWVHFESN